MLSQLRPAIVSMFILTVITGVIYPAVVTAIAKIAFPRQAEGSVIVTDGKSIGSEIIGQPFSDPKYFWPRPSATSPMPYAADAGAGSNFSQSNPALLDVVKARVEALHAADPDNTLPIPVDLVTASGSGLDPHISVTAATYQAPRIARVRHMSQDDVRRMIDRFTEDRTMGVIGEPRVDVLKLNLAFNARP